MRARAKDFYIAHLQNKKNDTKINLDTFLTTLGYIAERFGFPFTFTHVIEMGEKDLE